MNTLIAVLSPGIGLFATYKIRFMGIKEHGLASAELAALFFGVPLGIVNGVAFVGLSSNGVIPDSPISAMVLGGLMVGAFYAFPMSISNSGGPKILKRTAVPFGASKKF